jgi:hypothetical protein
MTRIRKKEKTLTTEDAEEHRGGSEEPKAKGQRLRAKGQKLSQKLRAKS